jgi:hypothetical protein
MSAAHKYHAKRAEWRGVTYDSKAEAAYARELDLRKAAGDIRNWWRSPAIVLVPGKRGTRIEYRPDFVVLESNGERYFVDVKGVETAVWKLKARLFRHVYPDSRLLIVGKDGERWL